MRIQSVAVLFISIMGIMAFSSWESIQRHKKKNQQLHNTTHKYTDQLHYVLNQRVKDAQHELSFLFKNKQAQFKGATSFLYMAELGATTGNYLQIKWKRVLDASFARWSDQEVLDSVKSFANHMKLSANVIYFRRVASKYGEPFIATFMQVGREVYLGFLPIYFFSDIDENYKGRNERAIVVDDGGYAFVYPERRHLAHKVGEHSIIKAILSEKKFNGSGEYLDFKGQKMIGAYKRAHHSNLYAAITQPLPPRGAWIKEMLNQFIMTIAIMFIAAGFLLTFEASFTSRYEYLYNGIGSLISGTALPLAAGKGPFWSKAETVLTSIQQQINATKTMPVEPNTPISGTQEGSNEIKDRGLTLAQSLRSTLSVILGHIQMASEKVKNGDIAGHLKTAQEEARRLENVNDELLHLMGYKEIDSSQVDLRNVVLSEISSFDKSFSSDRIRVSKNMPESVFVCAEQNQLQRLVTRLFKTSLESMKQSAQKDLVIEISHKGEQVYLNIKDTGNRISEEIIQQVSDPSSSFSKNESPLSVNLTIVNGLMKSLGGHFEVSTDPNTGNKFALVFPKAQLEEESMESTDSLEGSAPMAMPTTKGKGSPSAALLDQMPLSEESAKHLPTKPENDGLPSLDKLIESTDMTQPFIKKTATDNDDTEGEKDNEEIWDERTVFIGNITPESSKRFSLGSDLKTSTDDEIKNLSQTPKEKEGREDEKSPKASSEEEIYGRSFHDLLESSGNVDTPQNSDNSENRSSQQNDEEDWEGMTFFLGNINTASSENPFLTPDLQNPSDDATIISSQVLTEEQIKREEEKDTQKVIVKEPPPTHDEKPSVANQHTTSEALMNESHNEVNEIVQVTDTTTQKTPLPPLTSEEVSEGKPLDLLKAEIKSSVEEPQPIDSLHQEIVQKSHEKLSSKKPTAPPLGLSDTQSSSSSSHKEELKVVAQEEPLAKPKEQENNVDVKEGQLLNQAVDEVSSDKFVSGELSLTHSTSLNIPPDDVPPKETVVFEKEGAGDGNQADNQDKYKEDGSPLVDPFDSFESNDDFLSKETISSLSLPVLDETSLSEPPPLNIEEIEELEEVDAEESEFLIEKTNSLIAEELPVDDESLGVFPLPSYEETITSHDFLVKEMQEVELEESTKASDAKPLSGDPLSVESIKKDEEGKDEDNDLDDSDQKLISRYGIIWG